MRMLLVLVLLLNFPIHADDADHYRSGKDVIAQMTIQLPQEASISEVPHYQGDQVNETSYFENHHLMNDKANQMTHDPHNDAGKALNDGAMTSAEFDERFTDDHPLIKASNEIQADPMSSIGGTLHHERSNVEIVETKHVCVEAGQEAIYSCVETRFVHPKTFQEKRYVKTVISGMKAHAYTVSRGWGRKKTLYTPVPFSYEVKDPSLKESLDGAGTYYTHIKPIYEDVEVISDDITADAIESTCHPYEVMAEKGLCRYGQRTVLESPKTRTINTELGPIEITRPWWKRQQTYICQHPSPNTCSAYRSKGCEQISTKCLTRQGGICVEYEKVFLCRSKRYDNGKTCIKGKVPFCLDGNCDDHSWGENEDFANAMSKLALFKEMSKDMEGKEPKVFKGQDKRCSKSTLSFQDCCGSGGWGEKAGLAKKCSQDEKDLKKERNGKKCVYVGTYCAEKDKITKTCLKKKSTYCCYSSKLARILQEQGRVQLGLGWGSPERPQCRGLDVEELQRIDFGKLDLSDLYAEIQSKTNIGSVKNAAKNLGRSWADKIQSVRKREERKKKGVKHGAVSDEA